MLHPDQKHPQPGPRIVVVGFGLVGHRTATEILTRDPGARVSVIGEEPGWAYDRVHLSDYVGTWDRAQLELAPLPDQIEVISDRVTGIDPQARTLTLAHGDRTLAYDELVLATGSRAFVPPIPGHDRPECFVYRTLDDLLEIRTAVEFAKDRPDGPVAVVVGGGLLGLEAANALRNMGAQTHVVEMASHLMPLQVDDAGGELLAESIRGLGVRVHTGAASRSVEPAADRDGAVVLDLGEEGTIVADVVVFSAGIRARDELAEAAGLERGPRGGFLTDRQCATNLAHVSAVGECAAIDGTVYGLVAPGNTMADLVADRLTGSPAGDFQDPDMSTKLKLMGVDVASFGDPFTDRVDTTAVQVNDPVGGVYKKLLLDADRSTLLGGILVGDAGAYSLLRPMVGSQLPEDPMAMIAPAGSSTPALGVSALPDGAQICSCNDVSKKDIRSAIGEGNHSVGDLKSCTRAGSSCGSCLNLLKDLLDAEGIEQSTAVCEHFPQSRAELFEIARSTGTTDFSVFIRRFGTGLGCELCKPTLASIFATLRTGDHVLDDGRASLQDTNDRFLANIQRNGTYSVVPRLPAGQVTAEQLRVIGEIAADYDLYTKISGAQRIVMFGARTEQLPEIWHRLVDAGMESGQAYGKSLRAVKSCVGTDWCRYGQQDSVGMAVHLELRYRGLRSPHKLKMGVSGCARECAEARSKDVGVIATEDGWNLYVGGNGGATPRHAQLLARDLDDPTLIAYIDRYLGFYVRTADRMQRTAVWQEALDGGLDHIRDVVVDDSLHIAADLEAFVESHVGSYRDEWSAVLEDPEKLSRFVSFVNAPDAPDPTVSFRTEQGRKVPVPLPLPTVTP